MDGIIKTINVCISLVRFSTGAYNFFSILRCAAGGEDVMCEPAPRSLLIALSLHLIILKIPLTLTLFRGKQQAIMGYIESSLRNIAPRHMA